MSDLLPRNRSRECLYSLRICLLRAACFVISSSYSSIILFSSEIFVVLLLWWRHLLVTLLTAIVFKRILIVSYWFIIDPCAVAFKRVNVINSTLVAMETAAVRHYPTVTKHRNKGYFDQNDTVLIPNVTQFVHKAYVIANKVQKFELL